VVYILDQVRALEAEMRRRLAEQGLPDVAPRVLVVTRLIPHSMGTTCHQRMERIHGTEHAYILRVPFRDADGRVSTGMHAAVECIVLLAPIYSMYIHQVLCWSVAVIYQSYKSCCCQVTFLLPPILLAPGA
jgi:hypothetical protein